jgi:hypothetical protein
MIERIRFVTHAVGSWLGLRTVPIGILYLYLAIQQLDLRGFPQQGDLTLFCPLFLLVILGFIGIELYYRRTIGQVKLWPRSASAIITAVVVMIIGMAGWVIDTGYILPVSLFALFMAICNLIFGWTEKRSFQVTIGVLLAIAGFLPIILNIPQKDLIFGTGGFVIMFLVFLMFTMGGILDHLTIVRALRSSSLNADAQGGEDVRAG